MNSRNETAQASDTSWRSSFALGTIAVLTMLPVTVVVPVLKELVGQRFAAAAFWTHSFMAINMIGAVLAAPLVARIADRAGRRLLVVTALILDAGLFAAMILAPGLAALLTLRLFEGAAHILALSALMATAADIAPPGRSGRIMGVLGSCMMLGTAAGTRLGGLIWQHWPAASFETAALLALLAAACAWLCLPRMTGRLGVRETVSRFGALRARPVLAVPYAFTFADRFCVGVVISSFVLFLADVHGLDPNVRSRLLAMFLGPFALLVYPAGRLVDRLGAVLPLVGGSLGFGVLFGAYGFIPTAWLPGAMLASSVLSALMFAPTLSLCASLAPPGRRGDAFAGFNAAGSLGFIAGPLVAGLAYAVCSPTFGVSGGFRAAFIVAGAGQVACVALALRKLIVLSRAERQPAKQPSISATPDVAASLEMPVGVVD